MINVTDYIKRTCRMCKKNDRCHPKHMGDPCFFCGFVEKINLSLKDIF